jgi:hypothetical protein
MKPQKPFQAKRGANQVVSATGTSASVTVDANWGSVRVVNSGSNIAYFRIGTGTQTATTADTPILSGDSIVMDKFKGENTVAYISASGTTLNIQEGEGGI